jgi:hypothetical protein
VLRLQRQPIHAEFEHGVTAQAVRIITVRIAGGDLVDALGQQVPQGMSNIGLMSFIMDSCSEALGQANLTINPT